MLTEYDIDRSEQYKFYFPLCVLNLLICLLYVCNHSKLEIQLIRLIHFVFVITLALAQRDRIKRLLLYHKHNPFLIYELGSSGWQPTMLTTRPCHMVSKVTAHQTNKERNKSMSSPKSQEGGLLQNEVKTCFYLSLFIYWKRGKGKRKKGLFVM